MSGLERTCVIVANRLMLGGLLLIWRASGNAGAVLSHIPLCQKPLALIADSLLGPAEDFEYVSTTAPTTPPPHSP